MTTMLGLDPPDENPNEPFGGYGQGNIHGRSSLLGSSQAPPPPALPPYRTGKSLLALDVE